ncbi:MAG TPA: bifunctional DNA-formamidopyrimidine glycosylase/DNA-(apurinic or apyrimidinic site) lyase [Bdellovibrionales bacterium]|nr:bifunctional DNA-formamidopyrimidine glycosylase/DNA-(apurinic or apyrimidinic site) lyase [Bdellovibrionales bacterium]
MPELPEVETVRRGLEEIVAKRPRIKKIRLLRKDIRFAIPRKLPQFFEGERIVGIRRRAKYLLIDTEHRSLLSHLGMTGSWRVLQGDLDKHDHFLIELEDGRTLAFRDPRRFGIIDFVERGAEETHVRLKHLGPEPLDESAFTTDLFFKRSRKRKSAIKVFLMDQETVVGVGNIYASEVLFRSRVKPTKLTGKITKDEASRIVSNVRLVLEEAIEAGGSSISDYRKADGESGAFQDRFMVYDRKGEPCRVCKGPIRSKVIGGRSTFWCPRCQP